MLNSRISDKIVEAATSPLVVGTTAAFSLLGIGSLCASHSTSDQESTGDIAPQLNIQAKAIQAKALSMLEAEGIPAEAHTYPTTRVEMVFLDTNSFVGQGTYLPMAYEGAQAEYQGVMALRPYGVSGIANGPNCLIVDGDPKTEPLIRGC